jgi:hypothetical protein
MVQKPKEMKKKTYKENSKQKKETDKAESYEDSGEEEDEDKSNVATISCRYERPSQRIVR